MKSLVEFTHSGMSIINPFIDDGGQFNPVDPTFYGFELIRAGDCTAWRKNYMDGYILITDGSGSFAPELGHPAEDVFIGEYADDDTLMESNTLADVEAFMAIAMDWGYSDIRDASARYEDLKDESERLEDWHDWPDLAEYMALDKYFSGK